MDDDCSCESCKNILVCQLYRNCLGKMKATDMYHFCRLYEIKPVVKENEIKL